MDPSDLSDLNPDYADFKRITRIGGAYVQRVILNLFQDPLKVSGRKKVI